MRNEQTNQDFHTYSESQVQLPCNEQLFSTLLASPEFHGQNSGSHMMMDQRFQMEHQTSHWGNAQFSYQQQPYNKDLNGVSLNIQYPYPACDQASETAETTNQVSPKFSHVWFYRKRICAFRNIVEQPSNTDAGLHYQPSHEISDNQLSETSKSTPKRYKNDEKRAEMRSEKQSAVRKELLSKMSAEERHDYNQRLRYGIPLDKGELTFEDYIKIEEKKSYYNERGKLRRSDERKLLSTPAKTPEDMEKARKIQEKRVRKNEKERRKRAEKRKLRIDRINQEKEIQLKQANQVIKTREEMEKARKVEERRARKSEINRRWRAKKKRLEQGRTNQEKGIEMKKTGNSNDKTVNWDLVSQQANQAPDNEPRVAGLPDSGSEGKPAKTSMVEEAHISDGPEQQGQTNEPSPEVDAMDQSIKRCIEVWKKEETPESYFAYMKKNYRLLSDEQKKELCQYRNKRQKRRRIEENLCLATTPFTPEDVERVQKIRERRAKIREQDRIRRENRAREKKKQQEQQKVAAIDNKKNQEIDAVTPTVSVEHNELRQKQMVESTDKEKEVEEAPMEVDSTDAEMDNGPMEIGDKIDKTVEEVISLCIQLQKALDEVNSEQWEEKRNAILKKRKAIEIERIRRSRFRRYGVDPSDAELETEYESRMEKARAKEREKYKKRYLDPERRNREFQKSKERYKKRFLEEDQILASSALSSEHEEKVRMIEERRAWAVEMKRRREPETNRDVQGLYYQDGSLWENGQQISIDEEYWND